MENTQTPQTPVSTNDIIVAWSAPQRFQWKRTKRWYAIGGSAVVAATAYGILTGSWPFAIVALLSGAMYFLLRDHVPEQKQIGIATEGILLGDAFTRWDELKGFWFLQTPEYTELRFTPKARRGDLVILVPGLDLTELRLLLGQFTPELTEKRENVVDFLLRISKL